MSKLYIRSQISLWFLILIVMPLFNSMKGLIFFLLFEVTLVKEIIYNGGYLLELSLVFQITFYFNF